MIETVFYNGLIQLGTNIYTNKSTHYGKLAGQVLSTGQYNHSGVKVAESVNDHYYYKADIIQDGTTSRTIKRGYPAIRRVRSIIDGVSSESITGYHSFTTGQANYTLQKTFNSSGVEETRETFIKYGWQVYSQLNTQKIMNPVVESQTKVGQQFICSEASKWQLQGGIWVPKKTFTWEGTGSAYFTAWTGTDPTANWKKTSEIITYNNLGTPAEIADEDNYHVASYFDNSGYRSLLSVKNATTTEIFADDFNRGSNVIGNSWYNEGSEWSILNGNIGIRDNTTAKLIVRQDLNSTVNANFIADFKFRIPDISNSGFLSF